MYSRIARWVTAFLTRENRVWRGVRTYGAIALAYLTAFTAVAYFLPNMLNTIATVTSDSNGVLGGQALSATELTPGWGFLRAATTLLVVLGALVLILPVAWVYTVTKPLQHDPSLVQSLVILPMVAAGIVIVVKDSLALAFGLAGIVAAVRFRNTLKDPKDAVYVFLALAVGVASGVGALDVAFVLSASFNAVVLFLWRYNICNIYEGCYIPKAKQRVVSGPVDSPRDAALTHAVTPPENSRLATLAVRVRKAESEFAKRSIERLLDKRHVGWSTIGLLGENGPEITMQYSVTMPDGEKRKRLLRRLAKVGAPYVIEARYLSRNGK